MPKGWRCHWFTFSLAVLATALLNFSFLSPFLLSGVSLAISPVIFYLFFDVLSHFCHLFARFRHNPSILYPFFNCFFLFLLPHSYFLTIFLSAADCQSFPGDFASSCSLWLFPVVSSPFLDFLFIFSCSFCSIEYFCLALPYTVLARPFLIATDILVPLKLSYF